MTNNDIEDVLSSVRRLVSDDRAPKADGKDTGAGRLLLTPALRVEDDAAPTASPAQEGVRPTTAVDGDAGRQSEPVTEAGGNRAKIDAADAVEVEETPPEQGSRGALFAESLVFGYVPPRREDLEAESDAEAESDTVPDAPEFEREADAPPGPDQRTLSDKIAALETAIQKIPQQWEPDDTGRDAYAGTDAPPMHWSEPSASEDRADPAPENAPLLLQDRVAEEDLIDEDMLRQLVADIVRSELQGPLGERITRNVRKLVRREIQRALAAQDLG
ncbi:hypothetical protein R5H30_03940 [Sulfitobacter sp. D35]|uniref:hypothetical protein n=1 Tax=Sulfitobacter sp. D35 TaxID=3083252 RepID=UPI00296E3385|nr:hypothetical protein [Sulfitobacter sp. D35]MDW4497122.1 hypothetical protein [Sulfitobacter sp. D35]